MYKNNRYASAVGTAVWIITLNFCLEHVTAIMSQRVIKTDYGLVRGTLRTFPNSNLPQVEVYKGLQYATTLGSELRFMPPTSPIHKWTGITITFDFKPVCPQRIPSIEKLREKIPHGRLDHIQRIIPFIQKQTEDCLYLNIYVPTTVTNSTNLIPVVLFIHTETYEFGTGNAYDGSALAAYGNVIVITVNFRLGPFGFLSRGDSNAQGNYAVLDLIAAMHYIRENIQAFGGDPNRVTLMGQGYGAALINLLMVSPVTKGAGAGSRLFKRAILLSGSALSTWALSGDPLRLTQLLADRLNCSSLWETSPILLECFNNKTVQEILSVEINTPKYTSGWGPVIDRRSVLPVDVRSLIEKGQSLFGDTDILLGVMKSEGLLFFSEEEISQGISELRKVQMMRTYVRNVYTYHRQFIYDVMWHEYSEYEQTENPALLRDEVMALLGDAQYVAPVIELADYHQHFPASTYLYSFNYPSRLDSYPRWAGGVHGDDLTYVFGAPLADGLEPFSSSFTDSEKMLSEAIMTYWTNFMKSGNPNTANANGDSGTGERRNRFMGIEWPSYNLDKQQYLHIAKGMRPTVRHHLQGSKMALWLELIPKFHKHDDLDMRYHLLENYNNMTLFDSDGVKALNYKQMLIPPPLTPPPPPSTITTVTTTLMTSSTTAMTSPKTKAQQFASPAGPIGKGLLPRTTPLPPHNDIIASSLGDSNETNKLSLSVTIGVGCTLLFLNIIIFAAIYYQKDKIRQERKARERALNREQSEHMLDSDPDGGIKSSSDSDGASSLATPSPPISGQQVVRTHVSTLPRQNRSPIPVTPPQAPYATLPVTHAPNHLNHQSISYPHNHANCTAQHNTTSPNGTYYSNAINMQHPRQNGDQRTLNQHDDVIHRNPHDRDVSRRMLKRGSPLDSPTENHIDHPSTVV